MNIESKLWWFGFRQVIPRPSGRWVACGPYRSHREAMEARDRAKAIDAELSTPFKASSKIEAQDKADRL